MSAPDFWREYENNVRQVYELMLRSVEADPKAVESPEYERDWWNLFESRLRIGALTYGTRLSPDECALFLDIISGERKLFKRRGRPRRDKTATLRGFHIAIFVDLLEADGWPPDAAVNHAVKIYGVARQTVYTAKKVHTEGPQYDGR